MNQNNELQQIQALVSNKFNNKYTIQKQLGQGSFSQVFQCIHNESNQKYAMKIIRLQEFSDKIQDYMINELTILQKNFDNPNIIRLIDSYQTQDYLIIIMEYCIFDLEYLRQNYYNDKIPEDQVIIILRQIANGLYFLHKNQIIHRDLKLENIGIFLNKIDEKEQFNKSLFKDITFKLLDFGLSKILNDTRTNTFLGTPSNMAPEILNDQDYTFKVDIYSLGCCLFRMITGQFPYKEKKVSQLLKKIKQESASFENIQNPQLREIVQNMLKENENERMDWETLYQTEFFERKNESIMSRMDLFLENNSQLYLQNRNLQQEIQNDHSARIIDSSFFNSQISDSWILQLNTYILNMRAAKSLQQFLNLQKNIPDISYLTLQYQFTKYIKYLLKFSNFIYQDLQEQLNQQLKSENTQIKKIQQFQEKVKQKQQDSDDISLWVLESKGLLMKLTYDISVAFNKLPKFRGSKKQFQTYKLLLVNPEQALKCNQTIFLQIKKLIQNIFFHTQSDYQETIEQIKLQLNQSLILLALIKAHLENKVSANFDSIYQELKLEKSADLLFDTLQEIFLEFGINYIEDEQQN